MSSYVIVKADNIGLYVFATARRAEVLEDLKAIGIEAVVLDVTNPHQIQAARKHVEQRSGGRLDMLVNNAFVLLLFSILYKVIIPRHDQWLMESLHRGRNYTVPALDVDFDEVQSLFETNLFAVMRMCKEFSPLLIQAKGSIINIGSVAAEIPYTFGSAYNASKAALHAYSSTLRVELQPFDVKVIVVVTGGIQSNIARTDRQLPEDSLYLPVNAEYQRRLKHSQEGAMPAEMYAEKVVAAALQRNPARELWKGNKASLVWFVSHFLPSWFKDFYFWRLFNMWKIVSHREAARKDK